MDAHFSTPPIPALTPKPDVVATPSAARPTPPPAHVPFSQVLALARGANAAVTGLPTAPLMATALRTPGAQTSLVSPMTPMPVASSVPVAAPTAGASGTASAEGPSTSGAGTDPGTAVAGALGGLTGADGGVEGALAQSQEMNLYFLQLQTQVDAQNRSYTALSNVLKSEHDTVKTAIGNIH